MSLGILVELFALVLAVSALLVQPKKNPAAPPSWPNLNAAGRLILLLIVAAGITKLVKHRLDAEGQQRSRAHQEAVIDSLQQSNRHLIKVMSVAGGYNARLHGVVRFAGTPSETKVRTALANLFLKFASVELSGVSKGETYRGRVDYGAHPEVARFLNLTRVNRDSELIPAHLAAMPASGSTAFYFEVRCPALKILNADQIQYVRYSSDPPMQARVVTMPEAWRDFRQLYGVDKLDVYRIDIEELGSVQIKQPLNPI